MNKTLKKAIESHIKQNRKAIAGDSPIVLPKVPYIMNFWKQKHVMHQTTNRIRKNSLVHNWSNLANK